jgi:aryl-alcohol dehydrogenase-like predicted oxidoreductase
MKKVTLGRTGLEVTVMGLGAGGHSRLGKSKDKSDENAVSVVRRALELGINFFDTAEVYRTEQYIGKALRGVQRDSVVISTKLSHRTDNRVKSPKEIEDSLDKSLNKLGTGFVDIYHVHGVLPVNYKEVTEKVLPVLLKMKDKGKIRFTGITEQFNSDRNNSMLTEAVRDDCWDVMMVGFNMLNHSARKTVFKTTIKKNIGVLCMFAVRKALADYESLKTLLEKSFEDGRISREQITPGSFIETLKKLCKDTPLSDIAYRYCLHEPGIHTVLSGTGSVPHLEENVKSTDHGSLPAETLEFINKVFKGINSLSGE